MIELSSRLLRIRDWWHFKIAHLLGFAYYLIFLVDIGPLESLWVLFIFLTGVIGISVTGHIVNDYYDRDNDLKAGKSNYLTKFKTKNILILLFIMQVPALVPWFILNINALTWMLIFLQYILYLLYSHPITGWKGRGIYGVLADALYGHAIPVLVTILALNQYLGGLNQKFFFLSTLLVWQILKGIRNIILHQIEDRKVDAAFHVSTFVVRNGGLYSLNFINRIILPVEILFLILITCLFSIELGSFYVGIIAFCVWTFFKFSGWKLFKIQYRQLKFKFLFFLNDYYEDWMPLIFLFFLIQRDFNFIILLGLHLILFRNTILNLKKDSVTIFNNVFPQNWSRLL